MLLKLIHKTCQMTAGTSSSSTSGPHSMQREDKIKLAASIFFRNYIRKFYPLYTPPLDDEDRKLIKESIVDLLMIADRKVQKQLSSALEEIA